MTDEVCPDCGGSSFTKDHGHNTCDDCGAKFAAPTGTLDDHIKKVSIPKPPKLSTSLKSKPRRKREPKLSESSFVGAYLAYHTVSTDAPKEYGWWLGVQLLGHAMGREHVNDIDPGEHRHNLYVLIVGPSTWARKSWSQRKARIIYPRALSVAKDFTPEALVKRLSTRGSSCVAWLGEFSRFLKDAKRSGGYMGKVFETLNELYDCDEVYERELMNTFFRIDNPYLSMSSTITPEMLVKHLDDELAVGGFLARWLIVKCEPDPKLSSRADIKKAKHLRESLEANLKALHNWSGFEFYTESVEDAGGKQVLRSAARVTKEEETIEQNACTFTLSEEALKRFNEIEKELQSEKWMTAAPFAGRYLSIILRAADILFISEYMYKGRMTYFGSMKEYLIDVGAKQLDDGAFVVDKKFIEEAWKYVEPCLEYAVVLVKAATVDKDTTKLQEKIFKEAPIQHSKVMQHLGFTAKTIMNPIQTLIQSSLIIQIPVQRSRGRPSSWYCRADYTGTNNCNSCSIKNECKLSNNW